jgi:curved DNA-binding protein CbpA
MAGQDHYAALGVPRTATDEEITRAYHRLVRRHHPDTGPPDTSAAHLEAALTAYGVLRDPARRAEYDRSLRRTPVTPPRPATPPRRTEPVIRVGPVRYHGPSR